MRKLSKLLLIINARCKIGFDYACFVTFRADSNIIRGSSSRGQFEIISKTIYLEVLPVEVSLRLYRKYRKANGRNIPSRNDSLITIRELTQTLIKFKQKAAGPTEMTTL